MFPSRDSRLPTNVPEGSAHVAEMVEEPTGGLQGSWRRLNRRIGRSLYVDLGGGSDSTLLLAGSGRSGTTWLAEVLNADNAYRYLFEPAHPDQAPYGLGLPARMYAHPGSADPRLERLAAAVAEGKARDRWTDQYNRKYVARRRLVKDIWINLLLGWLADAYPRMRIVLVLRHPCATAASQFGTQWGWRADPERFLDQPELMKDHLEPYRHLLKGQRDPFDDHVITWCVENLVPLRQLTPGRAHVLFYEHVWSTPERELPRLFGFAGRPWSPERLAHLTRPSSLSRAQGTVTRGRSPVEAWTEDVSPGRVRRVGEILAAFGLDALYDATDPMPRLPAEQAVALFSTG